MFANFRSSALNLQKFFVITKIFFLTVVQYTNVTWNFPNNYWLWINVYKLLAIFSQYVPSREIDIFADRPTVYMWRIWDWVYLLLLFSFFLFNFHYPTYLYIFEEVKHTVCWGQTFTNKAVNLDNLLITLGTFMLWWYFAWLDLLVHTCM